MIGNLKFVVPKIVSMSLIGLRGKPPVSWGNYCWIEMEGSDWEGCRVLNMWAENILAAYDLVRSPLHVIAYNDYCIVLDPRIPDEYYYNKLCFTGCCRPNIEVAREMYDLLGDPDYEFEQFVNLVSYYKKRNRRYDPKNRTVTHIAGVGK